MLNRSKKDRWESLKKPLVIIPAAIIGSALVVVAAIILYFSYYLNTPTAKTSHDINFQIKSGEGVREIAKRLEDNKVINNDFLFLVYLKVNGLAGDIMAGDYVLNTNNTPLTTIDILTKGKVASVKITIPEGWTNDQIATYLDEKGIVKKTDFLRATKKKYDYDFLANLPEGASVEGFLFPDTYDKTFLFVLR